MLHRNKVATSVQPNEGIKMLSLTLRNNDAEKFTMSNYGKASEYFWNVLLLVALATAPLLVIEQLM